MTAPALIVLTCVGLACACQSGREAAASTQETREHGAAAAPQNVAMQAQSRAAAQQTTPAGAAPAGPSARRFGGSGPQQDFVLQQIAGAKPIAFKALGTNGAVMRMRLAAPFDAAFKPVTSARPLGPAAEVAAYRLARCLDLDSVPPAVTRDLPVAQIREALDPEGKQPWSELRERMNVGEEQSVRGAAIYWIPDLADVGLEQRDALERASAWLALDGAVPDGKRGLASSLSTMLAFDYLIGNFDRWSGGNARGNAQATLLYLRDHDLAFPARMNAKLHRRLWQDMQRAQRFSRRFYTALAGLTRTCFEQELARDPAGARGELLGARQLAGVFDRHEALLSHIASLIALHGDAAVLAFE